LFLATAGLSLSQIGVVAAVYPAFWGMLQVVTGKLSDYTGRKHMLWMGMFLQGLSLLLFVNLESYGAFIATAALLGTGTAMVYPTFLAAIADLTHPKDRAESVGVFRLWRDGGYALGAIFSGIIADLFDLNLAILLTGILSAGSAIWILAGMNKLGRSAKKSGSSGT